MDENRRQGEEAARRGDERRSPYDGRTEAGKAWLAGYDAVKAEAKPAAKVEAGSPAAAADEKPEQKPTSESEPEDEGPVPTAKVGESTNPDVQHLAAERRAHEMVLAQADSTDANKRHARSSIDRIDGQLRKMGYVV